MLRGEGDGFEHPINEAVVDRIRAEWRVEGMSNCDAEDDRENMEFEDLEVEEQGRLPLKSLERIEEINPNEHKTFQFYSFD